MGCSHLHPPTSVAPLRPLPVNRGVLFFYLRWPQWFAPRRICAWCGLLIARGGVFSRGKVSHGVCTACSLKAMEEVRANLPHHAVRLALLFLPALLFFSSCERVEPPAPKYRAVRHEAVPVTWAAAETRRPSVEVIP